MGLLFEIVPRPDKATPAGGGNARLCLEVDDVAEVLRELQQRGVAIKKAKPEHGGMLASFYDPDQNEICLWEYSKGTAN